MNIVNDKLVYKDEKTKSKGYEIKGGSSKLKTPILDVSSKIGVSKKKFSENEREDLTYSTVTDLAKLRGWSTSVPFSTAVK